MGAPVLDWFASGSRGMKRLNDRQGQSIVELALLTPLLLVALYIPADFGISLFTAHLTQNAVRDGARIASTTDLMDDTKAATLATQVYANLPQLLVSGSKLVRVRYYGAGAAGCTQYVEVMAQGTYNFFLYRLIALLGVTAPNGISITRITQMRYEFQPNSNGGAGCASLSGSGTN